MRGRRNLASWAAAATVFVTGLLGSAYALGSRVDGEHRPCAYYPSGGVECDGFIQFESRQSNDRVRFGYESGKLGADRDRGFFRIKDLNGHIRADKGDCRREAPNELRCRDYESIEDFVISVGAGEDVVRAFPAADRPAERFTGLDYLAIGGTGDDRLIGNRADDTLSGDQGEDLLIGRAGDDWLRDEPPILANLRYGHDVFRGGPGNDTILARDNSRDRKINCGSGGNDFASIDRSDPKPTGCERVRRER